MQESDGDALAGLGSDDEEAFVDGDDEDDDGKVRDSAAPFYDLEHTAVKFVSVCCFFRFFCFFVCCCCQLSALIVAGFWC